MLPVPTRSPFDIDFTAGQGAIRPLAPPGNDFDNRLKEDGSAVYPAAPQVTSIVLGGTAATGNVATLTLTPTAGANGSAWADELTELSVSVTVGATETLDALGALIEAAAAAAQTVTSVADFDNYARWRDVASVEYVAASDTLVISGSDSDVRFTATLTANGSITSTQSSTGAEEDPLRIGIVGARDAYGTDGIEEIKAPVSGTVAADIMGVVMDSTQAAPAESGLTYKTYARGKDVVYRRKGSATVYAEAVVTAGNQVYVRKTAAATEVAGAIAGSATTDTVQITTVTPTAADDTVYRALVTIRDFFTDEIVAQGVIEMTSGTSATATQIVTGLKTSLADDNDQLDSLVVGTGTATLILTVAAGYKMDAPVNFGSSAGVLTAAETQAPASDHVLWAGAKVLTTTTAAGSAAIAIP